MLHTIQRPHSLTLATTVCVVSLYLALFLPGPLFVLTPQAAGSADTIVIWASDVPAATVSGNWSRTVDSTAAGRTVLWNKNAGSSRIAPALASPSNYFEVTFSAEAGTPYHLWVRVKAESNSSGNDSVHVQFSGSVDADGGAIDRIGTTSSAEVVLQNGTGATIHGWGWADNGWGTLGSDIYFASAGDQTLRVQQREDGAKIDQIVLSPTAYLTTAPGADRDDTVILSSTVEGSPSPLVRGPYLQRVTTASAFVVWATRQAGSSQVRYSGPSGAVTTVTATDKTYLASTTGMAFDYVQHEAQLTGLSPSTPYSYEILLDSVELMPAAAQFTSAPSTTGATVRFLAFGDSGVGSAAQRQLAGLMNSQTFDLVLHSGDVAYGTSASSGGGSYQQYQDWFFDIYAGWLSSYPAYPAIGNHDNSIGNARAYRNLFVLPTNGASGTYPGHAERFYSFNRGPVHFVVLDTELAFQDTTRRQAQLEWLSANLAAATEPWKIALLHRSPFSAGGEHGSDLEVRAAFSPLFEQYGVQLVVSGHEHDYERSVPWRIGSNGQAVTYVVTGGGGARLYPAGQAEWTAASRSAYHFVRGTVAGCQLTLEAIGLDAAVFDSTTLDRCAP